MQTNNPVFMNESDSREGWRRPGMARILLEFVFPRYCKVCGHRLDPSEEELCVSCFLGMPRLEYDMNGINPTERMLLTERSLVRAASVLQYSKESDYRNILFHLKYWRHPRVGVWLAKIGAQELLSKGFFDGIDCIVPMPITYWKEIKRGYNQCSFIAKGVRKATGIPVVSNTVKCVKVHSKQAGLGKYQRWNNAQDLFEVTNAAALQGKHILIVDDVATTGATLCSLIDTIEAMVPDIKVSVFTLALTR
jgi:ComF family protein